MNGENVVTNVHHKNRFYNQMKMWKWQENAAIYLVNFS